jgi:hypothetical protein
LAPKEFVPIAWHCAARLSTLRALAPEDDMQFFSVTKLLIAAAVTVSSSALAEVQKISTCHAALVELATFDKHLDDIRASKRYEPEQIEGLIANQRKYGPDFFTSQIFIQEEQSGSTYFDLRMFHGLWGAAKYRNVADWGCLNDDYPIAYFVGFRVRDIGDDGSILVTRERDIVNVISLKALDPKLDKHTKVKISQGDKVLCQDIGKGCEPGIFYGRE